MTAKEYLDKMDMAIGEQLINPNSIYYGRNGHLRFARECGYALNDFTESEQKEILSASYSKLYVKHCVLKPILDAQEWIKIMKGQIKKEQTMITMNEEEKMLLKIRITRIMQGGISDDYVNNILEHKNESGTTLMEDIVQNVLETSAYEDEGYYNNDDIKLAIGRELSARLGIEE